MDKDGKPDLLAGRGSTVTIFRSTNFPLLTSFSPQSASTGSSVIIHGRNFRATNSVKFGDSSATSFIVINDSTIIATIGFGQSGDISVSSIDSTGTISGFIYVPLVLALNSLNLTGSITNNGIVQLNWKTQETDIDTFFIERSADNNSYTAIGFLRNQVAQVDYTFFDKTPLAKNNYYRIKLKTKDGVYRFSNIINKQFFKSAITISPNPAESYILISGLDISSLTYINIYSAEGKLVLSKKANYAIERINIQSMAKDLYVIQIASKSHNESFNFFKVNKRP